MCALWAVYTDSIHQIKFIRYLCWEMNIRKKGTQTILCPQAARSFVGENYAKKCSSVIHAGVYPIEEATVPSQNE